MEKILGNPSASSSEDNNGEPRRGGLDFEDGDDGFHLPGRTSFIAEGGSGSGGGGESSGDAQFLMNSIKNLLQGVEGSSLEDEVEEIAAKANKPIIPTPSGKRVTFSKEEPETFEFPSFPHDQQQSSPAGLLLTRSDGSTLHPKLSNTTCRVLIALLGMFLSLFNAKFVIITFLSWEAAVYFINGFPNDEPSNSASSSGLVLLFTILGMRGTTVQRINFALKISSCIITDFSILAVCVILSKVAAASLASR